MKKPKKKSQMFCFFGILIVIFFTFITIFGDEGLMKLRKLYTLKDQVQKDTNELYRTNQRIAREITHLKDPINSERLIREKLGYVKSNEYILILSNEDKTETRPSIDSTLPSNT